MLSERNAVPLFKRELRIFYKPVNNSGYILFFDEYPELKNADSCADGYLQRLIDDHRYRNTNLKLILCGSYLDTMRDMLKPSQPLYRRMNQEIFLKPMDYYDSARFYPNYTNEDKVKIYSVFGGMPYYNSFIDDRKTPEENISSLCLGANSFFTSEMKLLIQQEISKEEYANDVFEVIAEGCSKFSEIKTKAAFDSPGTLSNILNKLEGMDLISRVFPINDVKNPKKLRYQIKDPFIQFYYSYIYKNMNAVGILSPADIFKENIQESFEAQFIPKAFEEISRQFLIRKNLAGQIKPPVTTIGKYWYDNPRAHTNGEFDIVTKDRQGYMFYECKFKNSPLSRQTIQEEISQVEKTTLQCFRYGFISKSGFDCLPEENWTFYTLDDLYDEKLEKSAD